MKVHDADHSHVLGKTGIVEKLITGRDGVARGAVVRLSSAKGPVTLRSPLQFLYPLEMSAQGQAPNDVIDDVTEPVDPKDSSTEQNVEYQRGQPRKASSLAREIRLCLN